MNTKRDRLDRRKHKIVTTVALFVCILIGASAYAQFNDNESTKNSHHSLIKVEKQPLMSDISLQKQTMSQIKAVQLPLFQEWNEPSKAEGNGQTKEKAKTKSIQQVSSKIVRESKTPTSLAPSNKGLKAFVYNADIPLSKEEQKYLYKLSQKRGLNYEKTLAVMQHESGYNAKEISETHDYGYFQINKVNHENLSKLLDTPNKPLDPYVNMEWGTYMLSNLYNYWESKGISGRELDEYVWSSYNKGIGGFRTHGKATKYIKLVRAAYSEVHQSM
ncbi:transglycosylase SLT domain-containing protein [Paenibacillus polymyxa]|uniref:transglycosylase SLT domain-containing protein n=1 Tax=Paenibacillus polymyxa TaxID=1406 RepID=UPI0001E6D38B|nr:transglycosylase SLT domain-containing protein [Paenibacillus polymyxa]WPQ60008.1 transglycosylase SLT domain-containing protein [Paenibacillus polymyxa]